MKVKIKVRTLQRLYVAARMLQSSAYKHLYTLKGNDLPTYEVEVGKYSQELDDILAQLRDVTLN